MTGRLGHLARRLERSIAQLDTPKMAGATIAHNAKVKELGYLIERLRECQMLVRTDSEQEWVNGIGQSLKQRVGIVLNCPIVA